MIEKVLLGTIILYGRKMLADVIECGLEEDNFNDQRHRELFNEMKRIYAKGKFVNFKEIVLAFGDENLHKIGGIQYLVDLLDEAGDPSKIKEYATSLYGGRKF